MVRHNGCVSSDGRRTGWVVVTFLWALTAVPDAKIGDQRLGSRLWVDQS
jgi:hypothetical protein